MTPESPESPPGSPQIDADVVERLRELETEIERLRAAILEACEIMGEDMEGTLPTWPPAHEWLVQCAREWRQNIDEADDEIERLREELADAHQDMFHLKKYLASTEMALDAIEATQ